MPLPAVGDRAPQFTLQDTQGRRIKLADLKGKKVVLYFYPKDLTPGCTKEACGFRDDMTKFEKKDIEVLGVSADDVKSHQQFTEKYELNFPLLSDPDHKVADLYGVWQEKNMYGRKSWGIKRTTFIIDEEGKIARVFAKVDTSTHSRDVLESLKKLS